jgi:hypothetical protein
LAIARDVVAWMLDDKEKKSERRMAIRRASKICSNKMWAKSGRQIGESSEFSNEVTSDCRAYLEFALIFSELLTGK